MNENIDVTQKNAKVEEFLRRPGYQMNFRHALYTVYRLKKLTEKKERKAELARFASESHFLLRRTLDPGLYRFVKKEMMNRGWYWRQVKELGYLILLDVLHSEDATPTRAARKHGVPPNITRDFSTEWVTGRQLQRIRRENYPEIFFTPTRDTKITKDKRSTRFSTIFSDMSGVDEADWEAAFQILIVQDMARLSYTEKIREMRELHAGLRMVDPDDISNLRKFWGYQKTSLRIITSKFGRASKEASWIIPHIAKGTLILEAIYQLIDDAVALRWYRTIKSENKKLEMLRKKYPLRYTREDASKAVKENFEWFKDPVLVADYVFRGMHAYNQIGEFRAALYLLDECLKQIPLEEEDRGLCYHNIAWIHRMTERPRKFLIWLRKALATFEKLNNPFHETITWVFIAEAYYLLNNPQKSNDAAQQAKNILSNSNLSNFKLTEAYLCIADCAYRVKNRSWEKEALISALKPASELEDPECFLYFNQRLIDLEAGRDTLETEKESGKVKRPPLFRWYKEGSERFVPLSPRASNQRPAS